LAALADDCGAGDELELGISDPSNALRLRGAAIR